MHGQRRALAAEREAQRRAGGEHGPAPGRASPPPPPPSRQDLAATRAEFEKLAASAAPPFREHLESMAARYRELERRAK